MVEFSELSIIRNIKLNTGRQLLLQLKLLLYNCTNCLVFTPIVKLDEETDFTCSAPPVWPAAPVHQDSGSPSLPERPLVPTALHHGKRSLGWALGCPSMGGLGPCQGEKKGTPAEGEPRWSPLFLGCRWVSTLSVTMEWDGWSGAGVVRGSSSLTVGLPPQWAWLSPDWPPGWPWSQYDQRSSNLSWTQKKLNENDWWQIIKETKSKQWLTCCHHNQRDKYVLQLTFDKLIFSWSVLDFDVTVLSNDLSTKISFSPLFSLYV